MNKNESYEVLLKKSGLKSTKQRKAILEVLNSMELPATAEDVFLGLKDIDAAANLSTVYRTLEALSEQDIIRKISIVGEEKAFYEMLKASHRHFLICVNCKKMLPISGCPLEKYEKSLEEKTDFEISGHSLNLYGYCPACKHKN